MPRSHLRHLARLAVALSIFFASGASVASEEHIVCPSSLESTSVEIKNAPTGWVPFVATTFQLNSAAPMDGPPALLGYLKEVSHSKVANKQITKWEMSPGSNAYPDGKWIACKYGPINELVISTRIGDQVSNCVAAATVEKSGDKSIEIKCW